MYNQFWVHYVYCSLGRNKLCIKCVIRLSVHLWVIKNDVIYRMAFQLSYGLLNFGYFRVRSKRKQNADQYVLRFIFKQRKHVQAYLSIHLILIKLPRYLSRRHFVLMTSLICWWLNQDVSFQFITLKLPKWKEPQK